MGVLVRVFLREDEEIEGSPVYEKIVELLREEGVPSVVVLRAILGYGTTREYHYEGIEVLSYGLPVVVEFLTQEDRVERIVNRIGEYVKKGLISLEEAKVWG
ncbi:MAG: DUF190 domain-containing protein [Aquificota bacterium]|nr:DUF190 domain-containing protein [Aquificota bacterium]